MSNLGLHYIFFGLKQNGIGAERVFLSPSLLSVEGERHLRDFAVITASVAYEVDVIALMRLLSREKIPLSWNERAKVGGPIVGIGGALTYINRSSFPVWLTLCPWGWGGGIASGCESSARGDVLWP
jgi:hypothetical protein